MTNELLWEKCIFSSPAKSPFLLRVFRKAKDDFSLDEIEIILFKNKKNLLRDFKILNIIDLELRLLSFSEKELRDKRNKQGLYKVCNLELSDRGYISLSPVVLYDDYQKSLLSQKKNQS